MGLRELLYNRNNLFEVHAPEHGNLFFTMVDSRWTNGPIEFDEFHKTHLRDGNNYFNAYKSNAYPGCFFVDLKRSNYRTSSAKYVDNVIGYSVFSNDISKKKNDPSYKVPRYIMKSNGIDNFLDLLYYYKDSSAIGTGYTRDVRNLVVMDIDVDCLKPDNQEDLKNLLYVFANHNNLPDFIVYNKKSKHVQLQWLIQNLKYKQINDKLRLDIIEYLNLCKNKTGEVDLKNTDFTELTTEGMIYRRFTLAMCKLVNRPKFGDPHYTFWKAKNPMCALMGNYELELKMPLYQNGKIVFLSDEEMNEQFDTKEHRQRYFEEAPTLDEWYGRIADIMDPLVEKVKEDKVIKIKDAKDVKEEKKMKKKKKNDNPSRNDFVLETTRNTTWEMAVKYKYRKPIDIKNLTDTQLNKFKNEILAEVKRKYEEENEKYNGIWPGTSNLGNYSNTEFLKTFESSFKFAISKIDNKVHTDLDREKSLETRQKKKNIKLWIVDSILRKNKDIPRNELLNETNQELEKLKMKFTNQNTLKRLIRESKCLTDDDRCELFEKYKKILINI